MKDEHLIPGIEDMIIQIQLPMYEAAVFVFSSQRQKGNA
jgi:hypothetical protein